MLHESFIEEMERQIAYMREVDERAANALQHYIDKSLTGDLDDSVKILAIANPSTFAVGFLSGYASCEEGW